MKSWIVHLGWFLKGALLSYQGTYCDESFSFYSNLTVQPFCIPKVCEVYPNFPLRKMEDDLKSEFFEPPLGNRHDVA